MIKNVRVTRGGEPIKFSRRTVIGLRTAGVATLVMFASVLSTSVFAGATGNPSTLTGPVLYSGVNVTSCSGGHNPLDTILGLNLSNESQLPASSPDNGNHSADGITGSVNGNVLTVTSDSSTTIDYVVVKGGDGFNLYTGPASNVNQTFVAPQGFSHWFLCYGTLATPTITTTAGNTTDSLVLGSTGTISDTATVSSASGPTPTGSVIFYQCGPLTTGNQSCGASSGGTTSDPVNLVGGSASSPAFTPIAVGTYCFGATYSGDSNYSGISDNVSGDAVNQECLTVTAPSSTTQPPATSQIVTTASSNSDTGTISDTATVSGSLETGPTGTVTFFECGPLLANANCSTNGSTPVDLNGNSATSATFTPTASGIYCFGATYNGDSNYPSATENTDGDVMSAECVSVTVTTGSTVPATSNIVTTASSNSSAGTISDTATVTGSLETGPTGTVTFYQCGPLLANANCSTNASTPVILSGSGHATSATFTPSVSGIYCFGATYSGDSNYSSASENKDGDVMSAECVPVTVTTPTIPTGSITVTPPTTTTTPTTTPSITPTTIQVSPPTTPHGTKPPKLPTATIPSGAPSTGAGGSATSSDSGVVLTASGLALFAGLAGLVLIVRRRRHA
jgi:hypothetical protein